MKMIYNGAPIKSLNIKHYELNTNDCDMIASDLQAGKTAVAKGRKITGTGKSFEFARYGGFKTNLPMIIPSMINVIEIASTIYPIKSTISLSEMKSIDFSKSQTIGNIIVDAIENPIVATINDGILTLSCDKTVTLEVFYGKDNYV